MCGNTYSPIFPATGPGAMTNPSTPAAEPQQSRTIEVMKNQRETLLCLWLQHEPEPDGLPLPGRQVVDTVRLEGYRLAFRENGGGIGVATVLPEPDSFVDGVLWRISERDERRLDHYEGFPYLYGKAPVTVTGRNGQKLEVMVYSMNSPYKETPAMPSKAYLEGILNGCRQNGIEIESVLDAVWRTQRDTHHKVIPRKKPRQKNGEER